MRASDVRIERWLNEAPAEAQGIADMLEDNDVARVRVRRALRQREAPFGQLNSCAASEDEAGPWRVNRVALALLVVAEILLTLWIVVGRA